MKEIGKTAKIKHTQTNREKTIQEKTKTKKQGKQTKTKYNGKESKNREIKCQTTNRRGSDKIWPEAPLRKVAMGERHGGDAQMTCHRQQATKTPRFGRPKQGKKPTTRKKKGRGIGTRASSK
jgi:hypothetical protein